MQSSKDEEQIQVKTSGEISTTPAPARRGAHLFTDQPIVSMDKGPNAKIGPRLDKAILDGLEARVASPMRNSFQDGRLREWRSKTRGAHGSR